MNLFGHILDYDPRSFLFLLACILWWIEPLVFPSRMKGKDQGDSSFNLVFFGIVLSIGFSFLLIFMNFVFSFFYGGLFLMYAGVFFRYWSIHELGSFFTRGVKTTKNQRLISTGPYQWFKHPMYIGLFMITCGACLFLGGVLSLFGGFIIMFYVLKQRISLEEKVLINRFGDEYVKWRKNRF